MIIYGTRAAHLKSARPPHLICSNCNTQGSTTLSVYRQHAHIFWIPLFPLGRKAASQCQHCKQVLEGHQITGEARSEYERLSREARGPIWQFVGLFLIIVFAILATFTNNAEKKADKQFMDNPEVGDVYRYKTESGNYSTMKVAIIEADSIIVYQNEYENTKMSAVHTIEKEENYSEDNMYIFAKQALQEMYEKGEIYDVVRK
ncbi:MAG: zinc-ribbon domain-containing protein [Bacteroidia bacterium]|nr:zinc-ribbon domain-containing protein [Bacteroidia bacterium]